MTAFIDGDPKNLTVLSIALCVGGVLLVSGCEDKAGSGGAPSAETAAAKATASAKEEAPKKEEGISCDKVVEKFVATAKKKGDDAGPAEKKLWAGMCEDMKPELRKCIFNAKDDKEMDACGKGKKLKDM